MKWQIKLGKTSLFQKDLKRIKKAKNIQKKLPNIFENLEKNPLSDQFYLKKLRPKKDQKYRIRFGDFLIIVSLDVGNNIIIIHRIAPRSDVYK